MSDRGNDQPTGTPSEVPPGAGPWHTVFDISGGQDLAAAFLESLPGLFYLYDADGRMVSWNSNHSTLTGYSSEEIAGMRVPDWFYPDQHRRIQERIQEVLQSDRVVTIEAPLRRKDGSLLHCLFSGRRLMIDGRPHFCGLGIDITERKTLEQQLSQSQKMEAIGTLAGGIAHDFNNLLTAILGFAELAHLEVADRSSVAELLEQLMASAKRARDLVTKILVFSRKSEARAEATDVRTSVADVAKLLAASCPARIRVRCQLGDEPALVEADANEIQQVVLNLCTNALHAMRETGTGMEMTVDVVDAEDAATPGKTGRMVRLMVRDDGAGIPEDMRQRVFDPFFTTKPHGEGTGMGLSIVHGIVTDAGGFAEIESEPGEGAIVRLYFPGAAAAQERSPSMSESSPRIVGGNGERILLVEDDPHVVRVLQRQLLQLGYDVEPHIDGRSAERAYLADPESFDLVVTDQDMPHMTGSDLARSIRKRNPDAKILLISGVTDEVSMDGIEPSGFRFQPKPVTLRTLAAAIGEVLSD